MAELLWQGTVESMYPPRQTQGRTYTVALYYDGSGSCTCVDYALKSRKLPVYPPYQCKHIRQARTRYEVTSRLAIRAARPNAPTVPPDGQTEENTRLAPKIPVEATSDRFEPPGAVPGERTPQEIEL